MRTLPGLTVLLLVAISPHARAAALSKSCLAGDPFSCLEGGPSMAGATRACALSQPKGCMVAASLLLTGKPGKPAQALGFFDKACGLGDAIGCFELGKLLSAPGTKRLDAPRAFVVLYRSCRQGYGPACTEVGALHLAGLGTPKDPTRAAMAFHNGCERKHPAACGVLGGLLAKPVEAASAYHQGCQLKDANSCAQLAALTKKGVKPEPKLTPIIDPMIEAEKASRKEPGGRNPMPFAEVAVCPKLTGDQPCVTGDLAVCQQSAELQQNGGDGPAAYCMRRQACERGDGHACEQLGFAREGGALPPDPKLALAWYEKGCTGGSTAACANAVRLIESVEASTTDNQRMLRQLELKVRGCSLDDAGDCGLVYSDLLKRLADPKLAARAWITLGRWCEKDVRDGPACTVVADRRKAIALELECKAGRAVACREAVGLVPDQDRASALLGKACAMGDCESCASRRTLEGVKLADAKASQLKAAQVCPLECRAALVGGPEPKACEWGVRAILELPGPANELKAVVAAEDQCKRGFSCALLAQLYVAAEALSAADEKRVGAVLEAACAQKAPGTCQARAERLQANPARALCSQGQVDSCLVLGDQLKQANVELPQITRTWERACKLGSNVACVRHWASLRLAMSRDLKLIDQSREKAEIACDAGELAVCSELANHLRFRSGNPEAIQELKRVGEKLVTALEAQCDSGQANACETAANFLQFKKVLDGEARAKVLLSKACDHGAGGRCLEISEQRLKTKDFVGAAEYASKACVTGSSAGCRILAKHRTELKGAQLVQGDRALGVACANRVADACTLAKDAGVPTFSAR